MRLFIMVIILFLGMNLNFGLYAEETDGEESTSESVETMPDKTNKDAPYVEEEGYEEEEFQKKKPSSEEDDDYSDADYY